MKISFVLPCNNNKFVARTSLLFALHTTLSSSTPSIAAVLMEYVFGKLMHLHLADVSFR